MNMQRYLSATLIDERHSDKHVLANFCQIGSVQMKAEY